MKKITIFLATTIIIMSLLSCKQNAKLNQEGVDKAFKELLEISNPNAEYFQVNSINQIGPISQFSDNEASSIMQVDYSTPSVDRGMVNGAFQVKCLFKKNIDNKWLLTSIEAITHNNNWMGYYSWIRKSQNLNIIAQ